MTGRPNLTQETVDEIAAAASWLFAMSNLAPVAKEKHVQSEQARTVLDDAVKRLGELVPQDKKKK